MQPNLPNRSYSIIYADPPWQYECNMKDSGKRWTDGAHRHYNTMATVDISRIPVQTISRTDCLLFMWAVSPMLDEAMTVGKAWGFQFKTIAFVWDKQSTLAGYYTMPQCEMCLVFKKGKIPSPRGARNVRQFLSAKKGKHSEKPMEIRQRIDLMFPDQEKIEMFARDNTPLIPKPNWDFWGNEMSEGAKNV